MANFPLKPLLPSLLDMFFFENSGRREAEVGHGVPGHAQEYRRIYEFAHAGIRRVGRRSIQR